MSAEPTQPNRARRRGEWLIYLLLSVVLVATAIGQTTTEASSRLVVGLYENPPKIYRDQGQRPAGLFVDLIEAIADEHGWLLEYRDCDWSDCLQALEEGELDLMPDVAATDERKKSFAFHQVPVVHGWSQLFRPAHKDLLTVEDLSGLRISVLRDSVQHAWFESRPELNVELVPVPNMLDTFVAVEQGLADAAASNNFFGSRFASAYGLAEAAITFDQQSLHFAASSQADPQYLAIIDHSLLSWKAQRDSPYFQALQHAMAPPPVTRIPQWVMPLTLLMVLVVTSLAAFALLLRWRIQVRTRDLDQSRAQLVQVLDSSPVVLYRASSETLSPSWVSSNVKRLFALQPESLTLDQGWEQQIVQADRSLRLQTFSELSDLAQVAVEYRIIDGQGKVRHVRDEIRLASSNQGSSEVFGTWTDLTSEILQQERIRYLSEHDRMTGLPNRSVLNQQLNAALDSAEVSGQGGMVLMIDLDRFSLVNETVGIPVGDQVLAIQARRLLKLVSATDLVARSGNDEFCILLPEPENQQSTSRLCKKLLETMATPIELEGHRLTVTASIGVACFPEHGCSPSEIMAAVQLAAQQARKGGGNTWEVYHPQLGTATSARMFLEQDLNTALEQDQFLLLFQPQYRLADHQLVGLECLIRWQHPERGMLAPAAFIPLAEETGQIRRIDLWVLHNACRQMAEWQQSGLAMPRLSINLSASEFRNEDLVDTVEAVIGEYQLPADRLVLEITETTLMQSPDQVAVVLRRLHGLGIYLSMDDFGRGYSNLAQLLALPLDQLKIDRSLIAKMEQSPQKRSVLRAIVALATALDMELVAEGIETSEQLDFLRQEACPIGQGFLLGRPMGVEPVERLLRRQHHH